MTAPQTPTEAPEPAPIPAEEEKPHNPVKTAIEWGAIIFAALLAAFLIKTFAIQAFYIPSGSMEPTLHINDRVLVNKIKYKVERGALVVFDRPANAPSGDDVNHLVKRVIGLPNETVEGRENKVWINGKALEEPYLPAGTRILDFAPVTLGPDQYWVMGDNRLSSADSTKFGPLPKKLIVGRAFVRIWPPTSLKRL